MGKDFQKIDCMILGIRTRIIYDFLVIIQRSYMISLVSYKNRTKKSSMDSMKSYMILVWNQRSFNPGNVSKIWIQTQNYASVNFFLKQIKRQTVPEVLEKLKVHKSN